MKSILKDRMTRDGYHQHKKHGRRRTACSSKICPYCSKTPKQDNKNQIV